MPAVSTLHQASALTAYAQTLGVGGLSWPRIFPMQPVDKISDKYYTFGREELYSGDVLAQAPGTAPGEGDFSASTTTYTSYKYRWRSRMTDEELSNQDAAVRAQYRRTRLAYNKVQIAAEKRVQVLVYATASYGATAAAAAGWSTATAAQIEKDIEDAIETVQKTAGLDPNTIIIPAPNAKMAKRAFNAIRQYTDATLIQQATLGETVPLFGLNLLVPGGITNTANPGQTATIGRIWTSTSAVVAVAYINPDPGVTDASWTATFRWRPYGSSGEKAWTYENDDTESTFVEYGLHQTEDITSASCAAGITGV